MKRLIFFLSLTIALSLLSNTSYSQIHIGSPDSVINLLVGKWAWVSSRGGYAGGWVYPADVGYRTNFIFSKIDGATDSIAYLYYRNDTLMVDGKTKVSYSNISGWSLEKIYGFMPGKEYLTFYSNDTIALVDACSDCYRNFLGRNNNYNSSQYLLSDHRLTIFPNPSKNTIFVKLNNQSGFENVSIYDLYGRSVLVTKNIKGSIDISELSIGIYIIELRHGNETYRTKFMKE